MKTGVAIKKLLALVYFAATLVTCGCSKQDMRVYRTSPQMDPFVEFELAVYLLPGKTTDARIVLRHVLTDNTRVWKLVDVLPKEPFEPVVVARMENDVPDNYAPPDIAALVYRGYGLSEDQKSSLQKSKHALIMDFACPRSHVWLGLRAANEAAEIVARETGGLIWDQEARGVFSPDAWQGTRLKAWTGFLPKVSTQITVDIYQNGEFPREISMGMKKMGLPDLVVQQVPSSSEKHGAQLINLVAQTMAEGHLPRVQKDYYLDIRRVQNSEFRESELKSLKPNATGSICLNLRPAHPDEGDPRNELIELAFDRYRGNDIHAKQDAALSLLFGWQDDVKSISHSSELLAESQKEREKLSGLQKDFQKGMEAGEYISVKSPFPTIDGGHEWMWVEVHHWEGNDIEGILDNQPDEVPSLHAGQVVKVRQDEVFDYIHHLPDGHEEGNTTAGIIEKMSNERPFGTLKNEVPKQPSCNE